MKKKVITTAAVLLVIAAVLSLGIYSKRKNQVKPVKTAVVKKGDIKAYLSTTAVIKSKNAKDYFGTQLKIRNVRVKVGDAVAKGQNLINYDLSELSSQVNQAQLQYDNALLQKRELVSQRDSINSRINELDKKIKELEKSSDLSSKAALSGLQQQRSALQPIPESKLQQADNSVALAKSALDAANSKLSAVSSGIVSQLDGVVTSLTAVEGAVPNPSQPLVTVQDLNNLKAVVSLGKYDAEKVTLGQEASIKSGGSVFKGRLSFLSPAASKPSSPAGGETTLEGDIDILDKDTNLKVDFDVDVDILLDSKSNILKVPVEAIKSDKYGNSYVFVNSSGIATQRNIKTGIKSDTEAEVLQGLSGGEKLILNPGSVISNGTKVKEAA
ncbi:efflux RND transporter periplasmic adaptor subunit [Clostridium sp. CX1]|uniref:Efflux RND transporter periplasmic adaptor subunit n=1 Tax=Clostridium tanneri TaxID=3037988 RepID=A0ABU4JVF9_9CLOT|nr:MULTISPECIES: efflux RND transporter periplasmic adaptor subunit [unclassified Clostridium]MCT8975226.1 efflux RND transporter periplasmic adaptor subunit [Clostridium sp. CX1]MDW8802136.1 efflux RND transporter periplasmic adaptor subunit [Clostridium sp. A1-XYC3]